MLSCMGNAVDVARPEENGTEQLTAEDLKKELDALEGRDLHLWSIGILVAVVVAGGFMAVVLPSLWDSEFVRIQARFLPILLLAFIVIVVLTNIYLIDQRRQIKRARLQVFQQLLRAESAERDARMDPLTECFNRRCLEPLLMKEVKRAERLRTSLAVVVIDLDNFRDVNTKFGHVTGDLILKSAVKVFRETLRASDTIVRYGGDEFVLILPEASAPQAKCAMARVLKAVQTWNTKQEVEGYELKFSWGVAEHVQGLTGPELIDRADQEMYEAKHGQPGRSENSPAFSTARSS